MATRRVSTGLASKKAPEVSRDGYWHVATIEFTRLGQYPPEKSYRDLLLYTSVKYEERQKSSLWSRWKSSMIKAVGEVMFFNTLSVSFISCFRQLRNSQDVSL